MHNNHEHGEKITKLLQLQRQCTVRLVDQLLQRSHRPGPQLRVQLFPLRLGRAHLFLVVFVRRLRLPQQVLLVLLGALRPLQPDPPAALGIARPRAVVVLGQGIVFGLGLLHGHLGVAGLLLRVQSVVLPLFPSPLHVRRQHVQVLVHLVQREGELHAIVCHALVHLEHFRQLLRIRPAADLIALDILQLRLR